MNAIANAGVVPYGTGNILIEGKTKVVFESDSITCVVASKDDVTAGDGKKHDVIPGKGAWANQTTCAIFEFLKEHAIPLAYLEQIDDVAFIAMKCDMLLYEVVVRDSAAGSYLKRNPGVKPGQRFATPIVEFFLKTKGRVWEVPKPRGGFESISLDCDDPLMIYDEEMKMVELYNPSQPFIEGGFFRELPQNKVFRHRGEAQMLPEMARIALRTFQILRHSFRPYVHSSADLIDFKVEFGLGSKGELLLADVIDADSCRFIVDGVDISKQAYRDGAPLDVVAANYQKFLELCWKLD